MLVSGNKCRIIEKETVFYKIYSAETNVLILTILLKFKEEMLQDKM